MPRGAGAAAAHPGGDLGRHRRRGGRGFHRRPGIEVVVLFPKGLVSPTQQQQLTCWGDNVTQPRGARHLRRLPAPGEGGLPRSVAARSGASCPPPTASTSGACCRRRCTTPPAAWRSARATRRATPSFIIPSGNLGNVSGLPVGAAHGLSDRATSCWRTTPIAPCRDFLATRRAAAARQHARRWLRPWMSAIPATSSACCRCIPDAAALGRAAVSACVVDDDAIRGAHPQRITRRYGEIWCPHTATAAEVYARLPEAERRAQHWVLVATAHPAKFREIVEPLVGRRCRCRRICSACSNCRPRSPRSIPR